MKPAGRVTNKSVRMSIPAAIFLGMLTAALSTPISYGQSNKNVGASSSADGISSSVRFDVVSVKMHSPDNQGSRMQLLPDGIRLSNLPLQDLIVQAYGLVLNDQIVGLPGWAMSVRLDIEARVAGDDVPAFRKLTLDQVRTMGRPILIDRFKFASHEEKRVLPFYSLELAKGGAKLKRSALSDPDGKGTGTAPIGLVQMHHQSNATGTTPNLNELTAQGVTMDRLASTLSQQGLERVVLDNTGLADRFDFKLSWASASGATDANATTPDGPSIFTAVSEQLGLRLEPSKGPVPVLVIDHIVSPSLN